MTLLSFFDKSIVLGLIPAFYVLFILSFYFLSSNLLFWVAFIGDLQVIYWTIDGLYDIMLFFTDVSDYYFFTLAYDEL